MKKKLLSLFLASAMVVSIAACGNNGVTTNNAPENTGSTNEEVGDSSQEGSEQGGTKPTTPSGQLVIGSVTDLKSDFLPGWSNDSQNQACYLLLYEQGYSTVQFTKEGEFVYNPTVVKSHEETENPDGSKTFTITIQDGLTYNEGTPITARDYVFQALLVNSPEMGAIDGYTNTSDSVYVGYEEYSTSQTKNFKGVRLVDDMTYSVTVKADELPFHYDLYYANLIPYPISVIAPGCTVEDSEDGASITGEFTSDVLQETVNNPQTGYRYRPLVTAGPYQFESYDTTTKEGVLTVNPAFLGDYKGVKPLIEKIILKTVTSATSIDELRAGTVDLLSGISGGTEINGGLDLVDEGIAQKADYLRAGYGKIAFDCSVFPVDSVNVRQAISYIIDKDEFVRQYTGGYGKTVYSFYGLSQWEAVENADWLESELNHYDVDVEKAKSLLTEDGWTLNKDGGEYKEGDGTRYKRLEDGSLASLTINWANTPNNPVSTLLSSVLPDAMTEIGMELNPTTIEFGVLTESLMHRTDVQYHMYNLATGFTSAHSPWYYFSMDDDRMGLYNQNWIKDEDLARTSWAMKSIPYEDKEEWVEAWKEFIKTWNEKLPDIPLYSDQYHDFFTNKLKGYEPDGLWDWRYAIIDAYIQE